VCRTRWRFFASRAPPTHKTRRGEPFVLPGGGIRRFHCCHYARWQADEWPRGVMKYDKCRDSLFAPAEVPRKWTGAVLCRRQSIITCTYRTPHHGGRIYVYGTAHSHHNGYTRALSMHTHTNIKGCIIIIAVIIITWLNTASFFRRCARAARSIVAYCIIAARATCVYK